MLYTLIRVCTMHFALRFGAEHGATSSRNRDGVSGFLGESYTR